jgi:mono/diheme cytochrome c family protein
MIERTALFALGLAAALLDSTSGVAADINHGRQLARRWCISCHVVVSNQRQATTEAPPFATVARRPDFDASRVANFLLNPHPKMPNMSLTRIEAADLAAYIGSLAK